MAQRYNDSDARLRLINFIRNRLQEIDMSPSELAKALNLRRETKIYSLLSAKHYFPVELAEPLSDTTQSRW